MNWSESFKKTLIAFEQKFPVPKTEGEAQEWVIRLGQTFDYYHGSLGRWGSKKQTVNHPLTKDGLTCLNTLGMYTWDTVGSAGSPDARLNTNPETLNTNGQYFVYGGSVDWINGNTTPVPNPNPNPNPNPPPSGEVTLIEIYNLCQEIKEILDRHFK